MWGCEGKNGLKFRQSELIMLSLLTHAVSSGRQSFLFLNCIYFRGMCLIRAVREFYAFGLYIFANYALIIFLYSLFTG